MGQGPSPGSRTEPANQTELANLQKELPLSGELERYMSVAGHPDVVLGIDANAMFGPTPVNTPLGNRYLLLDRHVLQAPCSKRPVVTR